MDPQTYGRVGSMSAVVRQPETPDERRKALQALLACPTHSIQVKHQVCCRCPDLALECTVHYAKTTGPVVSALVTRCTLPLHAGAWRAGCSAA